MTQSLPKSAPSGVAIDTDAAACERFAKSHTGPCARPLGIARPRNDEQIESVVRWANQHSVPLVTVSSAGGPRRRGDTAIGGPGVVVDLSGMTGIIHVSGRDGIAVIEPGVTFRDLDEKLRPHGLRSFKPLLPRRNKSVLATFLEREPIISPQDHWDTSDPLSAISFTFGNGDPFRTGGASLPGSLETNLRRGHRQMMSLGPSSTDYTRVLMGAQGTLGIVHWASIYCERIPAREEAFFFETDALERAVSFVRSLALRQVWAHCFVLDRTQAAAAVGRDEAFDQAASTSEGGRRWLVYVSVAAPDARPDACMAWKRAELAALAEQAGIRLAQGGDLDAQALARRIQDLPEAPYKDRPKGAHREVFCLSQLNRVDGLLGAVEPLVSQATRQTAGGIAVGVYVQPTVQGASCHLDFTLFHTPRHAAEAAALDRRMVEVLAKAGGFLSRPYGEWSEIAFDRDPGIVPYLQKVKGMFDPGNVLNPNRLCF